MYCAQQEPKTILDNGSLFMLFSEFFVHPNKNMDAIKSVKKFFIGENFKMVNVIQIYEKYVNYL